MTTLELMRKIAVILTILWGLFFSMGALGSAILIALTGNKWAAMSQQEHFVLCVGIFLNWSVVMQAFFNRAVHNLRKGDWIPMNGHDTDHFKREPSANPS